MTLAHRVEASLARALLAGLRALGPVRASNLGGAVARWAGPWLPVSRVAHVNLRLALPDLDAAARRRVVRGAWENLGRTVAELPHVAALRRTASGPGWQIEGEATLHALREAGGPVIFASAHYGNWELLGAVGAAFGLPFAGVYRAAPNPLVDAMVLALRHEAGGAPMPMFPKGAGGARGAIAHLRGGGRLALLFDQKMNDGIEARLFGHPAMTASAPGAMALRFGCPLVPAYVQRIGPARFRVACEAPLALPASGDRRADVLAVTQALNGCLERWVRERPEHWLWMHRRWPKAAYRRQAKALPRPPS